MDNESLLSKHYGSMRLVGGLEGSVQAPGLFSQVQTFRIEEGVLVSLTIDLEDLLEASDHGFHPIPLEGDESPCVARYFSTEESYLAFKSWHEEAV